jgi:hypothetical protein
VKQDTAVIEWVVGKQVDWHISSAPPVNPRALAGLCGPRANVVTTGQFHYRRYAVTTPDAGAALRLIGIFHFWIVNRHAAAVVVYLTPWPWLALILQAATPIALSSLLTASIGLILRK